MSADDGRIPSAVRKSIEPLAKFYREHKPGVTRMVITSDDYDRLEKAAHATLRRNDFTVVAGKFYWGGFELVRKEAKEPPVTR
jgi:hypothetical protein